MAERMPTWPELDPEACEVAQRLRQGDSPRKAIDELDLFIRHIRDYSGRSSEAYAPLFLPALAEALDRIEFEPDDGPEFLVPILECLGPASVRLAGHRHALVREGVAAAVTTRSYRFMGEPPDVRGRLLNDPEVAAALIRLLDDPNDRVRQEAGYALAMIRPTRATARLLGQRLEDPAENVVAAAIQGLGVIGAEAADEVPKLLRFLDPERGGLCYFTLESLANLPLKPAYVKHLRPLLQRDWEKVPKEGLTNLTSLAVVLGQLGPAAQECVPDLERVLRLDDKVTDDLDRLYLACGLLRVDPRSALAKATLERFATSDKRDHRRDVIRSLEVYFPELQVPLRGLIEKLADDPDEKVRLAAFEMLGRLGGPAARKRVPELERLLRLDAEDFSDVKKPGIACALLQIDPDNALATTALERLARSNDHSVRLLVSMSVRDLPRALQVRLRGLIEKLADDPDEKVRGDAQEVLREIKGSASPR